MVSVRSLFFSPGSCNYTKGDINTFDGYQVHSLGTKYESVSVSLSREITHAKRGDLDKCQGTWLCFFTAYDRFYTTRPHLCQENIGIRSRCRTDYFRISFNGTGSCVGCNLHGSVIMVGLMYWHFATGTMGNHGRTCTLLTNDTSGILQPLE